jgi:hypothetical protein
MFITTEPETGYRWTASSSELIDSENVAKELRFGTVIKRRKI